MKQVAAIDSDKSAGDSLVKLNLELKTGKRQRSMELYPEFVTLLNRLSSDELKFPFAAFSDETVLDVDFPGITRWEGGKGGEEGTLCNKLLRLDNTGQRFYARLDALLKSPGNADEVEAYYLSLLCGFQGKYYADAPKRRGVIKEVAQYLRKEGRLPDTFLPEDEEMSDPPPAPENPWWRRWESLNKRWLLIWLLALLFLKLALLIFYVRPAMRELVK